MEKASVTSPIDFLKNSFEAVYGGYGWRHNGKSWEIQNTNVQKGYRGGMMCCVSCQSKLTALNCHTFYI